MKAKLIASATICGLVLVALLTGQSFSAGTDEHRIVRAPALPDVTASQHHGATTAGSTCEPVDAQGD